MIEWSKRLVLVFAFVFGGRVWGAVNLEGTDAELPAGMTLKWDQASVTKLNSKRAQISLDGLWRFMPATEGTLEPPKAGWAYIKVPGSWQNSGERAPDLVARGGGPTWERYDGAHVSRAWYERKVPIPADWQSRAISLRFDRVCTDAIVYVNGKECGKIAWPWGSVDITSTVKAGETANVRVLVAAIADAEQVGTFWQNALSSTVTFSSGSLKSRGLAGNVFLETRASEAHVTDVFVRTSTRRREVSLDVELAGLKQAGSVQVVAEMENEKAEVEKRFTAEVAVDAREMQTITASWSWLDPRLWDVGQGNLYILRLKVRGAGVDDEYNQRFGFREFWAEGRQFYLNGTTIHLRQPCFYNGPRGQVGDIFSEMGSESVDTRGDRADSGRNLEEADRKGYLVAQYVLNANKYLMNSRGQIPWEQGKEHALERANVWMRHYRNHPSVVMWIAGFNFFNNAVDADPRHIGQRGWGEGDPRWQRLMATGKDMFDELGNLDRTRVWYSHAGAHTGDIYTMNCYLDLIPLQEREEWLSAWAESGEMPVSMVEFGTPMDCTFRRARHGFESNITSEPLLTEYAAIYFGNDAYAVEEPRYRQYLHDLFRSGMLYGSSENRLDEYTNNHKIQQLFRANTWRSWRTAGLPGGLRTWSWSQDSLKEINGPTLAWIAGPKGAYAAKDHHFSPGQEIEKQIVLINDDRQPQDFTATWIATVAGKEMARNEVKGNLAVSEIRFVRLKLELPTGKIDGKLNGQIALAATIGKAVHHDSFAFHLFAEEKAARERVAVVDPAGLTSRMLASLGYQTQAWNGAAPLVVVGRNALKDDPSLLPKLEPYVQAGGRALICVQDPDWLARALGWRVCPKVARRVFPVYSATRHASLEPLGPDDLRDWTGSSTLIEAYPEYVGDYLRGNEREQPYAGWHWGNRGGVSSAAVEKPHCSGWRPLLECEFDLAYTPLMELDYRHGRLLVCTLDLEDHATQDPAARNTAARIIDYALRSPLSPRVSKVVYLGGPGGAAWLDKLAVNYSKSSTLDSDAGLLLVSPDAALESKVLMDYLKTGGRVFFLPRSGEDGWLGTRLQPSPTGFAGSLSAPEWPEARGLSASDLRWRSFLDTNVWVLVSGADIGANGLVGRKTIGKGTAVFCQIDPDRFQADQKTYFRYTRWRATRAVSQLLANLGAHFEVDARFFHPPSDWILKPATRDRSGPQATGVRAGSQATATGATETSPDIDYYHPDYRTDFPMGDNPYRYYRW
jgi:beta-galactosidase